MGYRAAIEPVMKVLISFSYLRFGVVGFSATLFSNRELLNCDEIYCHYRDPEVCSLNTQICEIKIKIYFQLLLKDMGMVGEDPKIQFSYIVGYLVLFRVLAYCTLKYRLTSELSNKIVHYAAKIVRQKE